MRITKKIITSEIKKGLKVQDLVYTSAVNARKSEQDKSIDEMEPMFTFDIDKINRIIRDYNGNKPMSIDLYTQIGFRNVKFDYLNGKIEINEYNTGWSGNENLSDDDLEIYGIIIRI